MLFLWRHAGLRWQGDQEGDQEGDQGDDQNQQFLWHKRAWMQCIPHDLKGPNLQSPSTFPDKEMTAKLMKLCSKTHFLTICQRTTNTQLLA